MPTLAERIVERRAAVAENPCSVVQLGLGDDLIRDLHAWANDVTYESASRAPQEFGPVFLAACTYFAREDAGEGSVWPQVRRYFRSDAERIFDDNGHPVTMVKDSIEAAVHRHRFRNTVERDRTNHRWYQTILLQCGWTKPVIEQLQCGLSV